MKKVFFLLPLFLLAAIASQAQNDAITRFFEKYVNDEKFTVVYISPKMFQMASKIEADDPDFATMESRFKHESMHARPCWHCFGANSQRSAHFEGRPRM